MDWPKIYILVGTYYIFWVWVCLFLAENLESKREWQTPKPFQLMGNNAFDKIVDIENDRENVISQTYEEIKKSKTVRKGRI
jgi:iron only hydrogenase large subunit-like protein